MIILLILLTIGTVIAYIRLEQKNTNLEQENQRLKDKVLYLEKDVRDQANKNIILQSVINQRDNK
jgi:hypothetical protein